MKPTILEFDMNAGQPINGAYKLGVLPAGFTVWSWHTGFVNGRPTATFVGLEPDPPADYGDPKDLLDAQRKINKSRDDS